MAFNTAVSGLRAANSDLGVVGNNIANASTTGFKSSRAEFADVYAASAFGGGGATVGSGVTVSDVSQQFSQGNIAFTNNALDLAINGNGFFIMSNNDATEYTRSGIFGVDADGTIVDSNGLSLQGFQASDTGAIGGTLTDLVIDTANIEPSQTTEVTSLFNLNAGEIEPAERGSTASSTGGAIGVVQPGDENGYDSEVINFTLADGTTRSVTTEANASAEEIASQINLIPSVSANAVNTMTMEVLGDAGTLEVSLNGVTLVASDAAGSITSREIAVAINDLTNTTLPGITAIPDPDSGTLIITSANGSDLNVSVNNSGNPGDSIRVTGTAGDPFILQGNGAGDGAGDGSNDDGFQAVVGGTIELTMNENVTVDTVINDGLQTDDGSNLFVTEIATAPFINNSFDPLNQDTFNHATSTSIFDSLGNAHVLTMYFVKESEPNAWTMYAQVDGENVGEPNPALEPPLNTEPTLAAYSLVFDNDGTLDENASDTVQITYWNPTGEDGEPNGALNGLTFVNGAEFPVTAPFTSSNFQVNLDDITQFGADFSVQDMSQNGFTTGRLADVQISDDGTMFTRFTNGQARVLGQVALANFANDQGLSPQGNSTWVETFESGVAVVGTPGSSALGVIQSGALEESNVDLSAELVNLIIAQRNFQANSKTIQTADAVTQSIINLR